MERQNSTSYDLQVVLPHDDNAEKNILGTIMNHDEMLQQVDDILDARAFYDTRNGELFRILKYIIQKRMVIDESAIMACYEKFKNKLTTSYEELQMVIMETNVCDSVMTFTQDVERVVEYSVRRAAWEMMQKASRKVVTLTEDSDDSIAETIKNLDSIRGTGKADSGVIDAKSAIKMVFDQISENLSGENSATVKTGFRFTDEKGGLRLGSVLVIGAFTSVGKSSLALNMAVNVARKNVPVAYYSLEMGAVELWSRIISSSTSVSAWKILNRPLKTEELAVIDKGVAHITNIPLYIDDKATTKFSKMMRSVRTMVKKYGIKIFFVDYLQIFSQNSKSSNEESNLGSMARECKNICRELNICCVILSQLRRDKDERHPTIDMLRGSGQIEESADNVVLIDRPDAHPEWGVKTFYGGGDAAGKAELRVCKGRNIGLGTYQVGFDPDRTQFYELDGYETESETITARNTDGQDTTYKDSVESQLPF